jgi:AcrR family transcriptional regulator
MKTKERILQEALQLFAKNGYMATSMSDIAKQLNITKPALYKHYTSKQEIFDSIIERMNQMDQERAKEYEMPEGTMEEMAEKYIHTSLEKIKTYSEAQFLHWTEDEFSSAFRRMLTLEQYRSKEMLQLYQQYLCGGPVSYMADLFGSMTGRQEETIQLALEFYSPIYLLYSMYDAADTSEKKMEIRSILKEHIDRFSESERFIKMFRA